ncbi:restriction endonuclease subunit S [Helicobacter suis]|uniref:restriction endonuclease subunit S n=1 Tax=Helicobacter suis TaxID=104628 RepID=UPI001F081785|nr:restriction endonuclease subunit S [Helicobacter suis]
MYITQKKALLERIKQRLLELLLDFKNYSLAEAPSTQDPILDAFNPPTSLIKHPLLKESFRVEWVRLGEVLSLEYGDSLPEYKRIIGKYPIMGSNGVVGYHNTFLIRSPAIIVGRKGSAGKVNYMDQDCYPIDTTYFVQLKIECSLKFVYYVLTNLQLEHLKTGGGVPGLNREHVYQILIPLPPLLIQEKIIHLISTLDNLIVLYAQQQTLLERITHHFRDQFAGELNDRERF